MLVKPGVVAVVIVTHLSDPPKVERRCAHDLVDRWSLRFIPEGGRREAGGGRREAGSGKREGKKAFPYVRVPRWMSKIALRRHLPQISQSRWRA
ncbi:MAG TPA: hypothetical protein VF858_06030, partial [Gemmatimonadaceae bacterium]